jgi:hypothetical protein
MRKYSALFAMIITLWAAFAPIGFSVLQVREQNQEMNRNVVVVKMNVASAQQAPDPNPQQPTPTPQPTITQQDVDAANAANNAQNAGSNGGNSVSNSIECSFLDLACNIFKLIINFILFIPIAILTISGLFMDVSMSIAINPYMYGAGNATLETGLRTAWAIVRDFSNIGFIFALFVIAFNLILNKTFLNFDPKKGVVRVIIMALLVNFSFLFSRLIIQTADIFSNVLYNKITSEQTSGDINLSNLGNTASLISATGYKSPSLSITSKINPQTLLMDSGFVDTGNSVTTVATAAALGGAYGGIQGGLWGAGFGAATGAYLFQFKTASFYVSYGLLAVMIFFICLTLIYVFIKSALLFLGRVFGLWLSIIISPIAFVSWSIPFLEKDKNVGFENWVTNLAKLAFMTPLFLFFIYLTVKILNLGNALIPLQIQDSQDTSLIPSLLRVLLPLVGATFILMRGMKLATDMSGVIGEMVGKMSGAVTGLALGAATGGAGFMARQTLGRGASALATSTAGSTGMVGKGINRMSKAVGASTFDVRNNKFAMDKFGKLTGAAGEKIDLGTRNLQKEGGYLASGGINQILADRKDRIADEQASAAEAAAKAAAENPQSRENIAKRNAERAVAANKKAKEAEEARIAMAAENTPIDNTKDQKDTNDAITANNARMTAIDTELAGKKEMTATELANNQSQKDKAEKDIAAADAKSADLEAKLAANAARRAPAGFGSVPDAERAAIAKEKADLEKEKIDNENQKIILQKDLADTTAKEKEHNDVQTLKAEKDKLNNDNNGLATKLVSLKNVNGKIPAQLKHDAAVAKLKAQDSPEGKVLAALDIELSEKNKEINELDKKAKELEKEGKVGEATDLKDKIKNLRQEMKESREGKKDKDGKLISKGKHQLAKEAFDAANGDIKEMEDAAKNATKTAISNGSARLTAITTEANKLQVDLLNANYAAQTKRKEILSAHANELDTRGTSSISNTLGVITGGVVGTVRGAGQNAATNVRNSARTGK